MDSILDGGHDNHKGVYPFLVKSIISPSISSEMRSKKWAYKSAVSDV